MSEYQRFVSYIYAYSIEGKGRNVGFAKVEVRGEQKRIGISLKGIYGSPILYVYGFCRKESRLKAILLGTMRMNSGNGQFQYGLLRDSILEVDCSFEQLCGLVIRSTEDAGKVYATVWDDEEFSISMFEKNSTAQDSSPEFEDTYPEEASENPPEEGMMSEESDRISGEENGTKEEDLKHEEMEQAEEQRQLSEEQAEKTAEGQGAESKQENMGESPEEGASEEQKYLESDLENQKDSIKPESQSEDEEQNGILQGECLGEENIFSAVELKNQVPSMLWEKMKETYPKAKPFSCEGGVECLKIKPGTIGKLPRQNWIFANNGFVLYGYMKYHYLVLCRIEGEPCKYMLGVPGMNYSKEQPVAELFGFEEFYHVGKDWGYWCISLEWEI